MDLASIASATHASLDACLKASEGVRLIARHDEISPPIELDVAISHHKFQSWYGQAQGTSVSAEAFRAIQSWEIIRQMLESITKASKDFETYLGGLHASDSRKPMSRWMAAAVKVFRVKKQSCGHLEDLQQMAARLSISVDRLWIYSETVSNSLHGALAQSPRLSECQMMIDSALQLRAGSLELHRLCSSSMKNCSLELNLLDSTGHDNDHLRLSYKLFTPTYKIPPGLQKLIVENILEVDVHNAGMGNVVDQNTLDFQFFPSQPGPGTTVVKASGHGSNSISYLLIPKTPAGKVALKSNPEGLDVVLERLPKATDFSTKEHFSVGAKVELAYKVTECGLFLLGTPWLSSLSSRKILRLRSPGERHKFILEINPLDSIDMLSNDPRALSETSQLFRIGILLMEIALNEPITSSWKEDDGHEVERISKLPLVQQAMGAQYCRATAFCLQFGQPGTQFCSPTNYQNNEPEEQELYLAEFLEAYCSQVFLRLQELREVDSASEYRSVRSSVDTQRDG